MDKIRRVIDLKKEKAFLEEYVSLRNRYHEVLLTKPVDVPETKEWLKCDDIEARGIVWGSDLIGVAILYLHREGEIAFFAKDPNQGIGEELLKAIEQVATQKQLKCIWAWVLLDNVAAKRSLQKSGYTMGGKSHRFYEGESRTGILFKKDIS